MHLAYVEDLSIQEHLEELIQTKMCFESGLNYIVLLYKDIKQNSSGFSFSFFTSLVSKLKAFKFYSNTSWN